MRFDQLLGDPGDIAAALAALVARQQQQGADQVGALLLGALDALQPLEHLLVQVRPRQQQLGGAADHRQRRAQLVADIGIELAVALDHLGQPPRVVVQRLGQLADLVVGEVRRQRLKVAAAAAVGTQPRHQVRDRTHHLGRRPPADQQRQAAEQHHRDVQRALELLLAADALGDVVGEEEPLVGRLAHRQLVGVRPPLIVHAADVVDAAGQFVPVRLLASQFVELVAPHHLGQHLLYGHVRAARGIQVEAARVLVDVAVHHVFDELAFHALARIVGQVREQGRQTRAQQHEGQDDAAAQAAAIAPAPARLGAASRFRHPVRRCGSRCHGESGSWVHRRACPPPRAIRECARAGNPSRAAPRPIPASPAPAG